MTHDKVYEQFIKLLPMFKKGVVEWFTNGLNSIRLRRMDNKEFIFTLDDDGQGFRYETKDSFIERLKRGTETVRC